MRWFKHDTDGHRSPGMIKLIEEFGVEGYGRWLILLEIVAERMDESDSCSVTLSVSEWCRRLRTRPKVLEKFLRSCSEVGEKSDFSATPAGTSLTIAIPNLLKKRDEYTSRIGTLSGQTLPKIKKKSKDKEKEREIPPLTPPNEGGNASVSKSSRNGFPESQETGQKSPVPRQKPKTSKTTHRSDKNPPEGLKTAISTWNEKKAQSWDFVHNPPKALASRFAKHEHDQDFDLSGIIARARGSDFLSTKKFVTLLWLVTTSEKTGNPNWRDVLNGRYDNARNGTGARAGHLTDTGIEF